MDCENGYCKSAMPPTFLMDRINNASAQAMSVSRFLDDNRIDFEQWVSEVLGLPSPIDIRSSWLNVKSYDGTDNGFEWHNELGEGAGEAHVHEGDFVGILWISGEMNKGGNLEVLLPTADLFCRDFRPNALIVFPINYLHRVNHYDGVQPRISLNFTFNLRGATDV